MHRPERSTESARAPRFVLRTAVALDFTAAVYCHGRRVQVDSDDEHGKPDGVSADV